MSTSEDDVCVESSCGHVLYSFTSAASALWCVRSCVLTVLLLLLPSLPHAVCVTGLSHRRQPQARDVQARPGCQHHSPWTGRHTLHLHTQPVLPTGRCAFVDGFVAAVDVDVIHGLALGSLATERRTSSSRRVADALLLAGCLNVFLLLLLLLPPHVAQWLLLCCETHTTQPLWDELSGPFKQAIDSFRLVDTTRDYIPPDQNPW